MGSGSIAAGAGTGAGLGSIVMPGVGTVLGGAIGAGVGALGGVIGGLANNRLQKRNRERVDDLLALEESGSLGLTPVEQRTLQNELYSPVREAATAGRQRAEQIASAAGGSSGGDLSRLRTEQTRIQGEGGQRAAAAVAAASAQKKQAQELEIEQRLSAQAAMRGEDTSKILGGIASTAAAGGNIMAAAQEHQDLRRLQEAALGGSAPALALATTGATAGETLEAYKLRDPEGYRRMLSEAARTQGLL